MAVDDVSGADLRSGRPLYRSDLADDRDTRLGDRDDYVYEDESSPSVSHVARTERNAERRNRRKNSPTQAAPSRDPEAEYEANRLRETAKYQALRLESAAEAEDPVEQGNAGSDLRRTVERLWGVRKVLPDPVVNIVNQLRGVLTKADIPALTAAQCRNIHTAVREHLGPRTVDMDDVEHVMDLLEGVDLDPLGPISGEPQHP